MSRSRDASFFSIAELFKRFLNDHRRGRRWLVETVHREGHSERGELVAMHLGGTCELLLTTAERRATPNTHWTACEDLTIRIECQDFTVHPTERGYVLMPSDPEGSRAAEDGQLITIVVAETARLPLAGASERDGRSFVNLGSPIPAPA